MKETGYGKEYQYTPKYLDGKVKQDYLPKELLGKMFLESKDLGDEIDSELYEAKGEPYVHYENQLQEFDRSQ